jgi:hypothetical protein
LGIISAKIKTTMVVAAVETSKINSSFIVNKWVNRTVDIDAAAILTKLLPIKIVEKNSSGVFSIFFNMTAFFSFLLALRLSLILFRDNSDVSADEKKALKRINRIKIKIYSVNIFFNP